MALRSPNETLENTSNDDELVRFAYVDLMASVASTFIKYRTDHKLTQKDLAQRLGISQVMISRIENGAWNFSIEKLNKYVKKMGGKLTIKIEFPDSWNKHTENSKYEISSKR